MCKNVKEKLFKYLKFKEIVLLIVINLSVMISMINPVDYWPAEQGSKFGTWADFVLNASLS